MVVYHRYLMLVGDKFIQGFINIENGKLESLVQDQIILSKNWAEQLQSLEEKILFVGTDISLHHDVFTAVLR